MADGGRVEQEPTVADLRSALIALRDGARNLLRVGWALTDDFDQVLKGRATVLAHSSSLGLEIDALRGDLSAECQTWERVYAHASQNPNVPGLKDAVLGKDPQRDGSPQRIIERCDALLAAILWTEAANFGRRGPR
jgi:hypothetical protein